MDKQDKNSKRYQNSDYPSGSLEEALKTENKPPLRLKREPSQETLPREDFDEMVPEFMHRGFFRSEEGPAVEPSGHLRTGRPDWESDTMEVPQQKAPASLSNLVPLRAAATPTEPPCTEPEPEEVERELKPLASVRSPEPAAPAEQAIPLRTPPPEPAPSAPTPEPVSSQPPPPPASPTTEDSNSSKVSGALVLLLLTVVAVFVWRERTRTPVVQEPPLPVPSRVVVQEAPPQPAPTTGAPAEESPYPAMSPVASKPIPVTVVEPSVEVPEPDENATAEEVAASRTAILENLAETTGETESPESTPESGPAVPVAAAIAPPAESPVIPEPWRTSGPGEEEPASLFPSTAPVEKPPTAEPPTAESPKEPVAAEGGSLFPAAGQQPENPVATTPPVTPPPVEPLPTVEGDPYKIAEPSL